LGSYDGIIGLDWLAWHSPMEANWDKTWIKIPYGSARVTLIGDNQGEIAYTLVERSPIIAEDSLPIHPLVQ
jgi:hypothetical protein